MFEQILSISKIGNIWGTVTRIYMSISGLKGLRNKLLSASDFFLVSHKNTSMALALFSTQAIFDGVNERCVGRYVQSPGFNAKNN